MDCVYNDCSDRRKSDKPLFLHARDKSTRSESNYRRRDLDQQALAVCRPKLFVPENRRHSTPQKPLKFLMLNHPSIIRANSQEFPKIFPIPLLQRYSQLRIFLPHERHINSRLLQKIRYQRFDGLPFPEPSNGLLRCCSRPAFCAG